MTSSKTMQARLHMSAGVLYFAPSSTWRRTWHRHAWSLGFRVYALLDMRNKGHNMSCRSARSERLPECHAHTLTTPACDTSHGEEPMDQCEAIVMAFVA